MRKFFLLGEKVADGNIATDRKRLCSLAEGLTQLPVSKSNQSLSFITYTNSLIIRNLRAV